jgi:peptidoglycan/LPS O-acetylase OafA/YrhL
MSKYCDFSNSFTRWMSKRSFGLYVFHYLGISSVALFVARRGILPAPAVYILSVIAGFAGGYILNGIISRIPGYRWAVLGIKEGKKNVQG